MFSKLFSNSCCAPLAPIGCGAIDVDDYAREGSNVVVYNCIGTRARAVDSNEVCFMGPFPVFSVSNVSSYYLGSTMQNQVFFYICTALGKLLWLNCHCDGNKKKSIVTFFNSHCCYSVF